MKALIFFLLSICSSLILVSGCSDDPADIGLGVLPSQDTVRTETREFLATSDTTFRERINGTSGRLLVGKYEDIEARSLLEFTGVPIFSPGTTIDSAYITLSTDYRFGDSLGEFGFTAYKRAPSWSSDPKVFNWDSVSASSGEQVGSFQASASTPNDTIIRFALDTALIREWSLTNGGIGSIVLVPAVTTGRVLGFTNVGPLPSDTRPQLTISYRDSLDSAKTSIQRAPRAMFVADASPPPQSGDRIILQAGVVLRSRIRFDSLTIPPKASITDATLELRVDEAHSFTNSFTRDSMLVYLLKGSTYPFDSVALGTLLHPIHQASQKVYTADVKNIVQQWVGKHPNYGIALRAYNEFKSLDRFTLNGIQGTAIEFRPKLTVTYTLFP